MVTDGNQCADLFAFNAENVDEFASAPHTRVFNWRLFPKVGQHFVTNQRRPILLFEEDTSPGIHDMLIAACDPTRFAQVGVTEWHASCQENLQIAMREQGFPEVEIPQPINLFSNFPVSADLSIEPLLSPAQKGDFAQMRAEMDAIVVVSACPADFVPINNFRPSGLAIDVLD